MGNYGEPPAPLTYTHTHPPAALLAGGREGRAAIARPLPLRGWRRIQARRGLMCLYSGPRITLLRAGPATRRLRQPAGYLCVHKSVQNGGQYRRSRRSKGTRQKEWPYPHARAHQQASDHRWCAGGHRRALPRLQPRQARHATSPLSPRHAQLARLPLRISQVALHPWRSLDGARPVLQWLRSGPGPRPRGHVQALPKRRVLLSCRGARWAQE